MPESEDDRILEAAAILLRRGVADLILLGEETKVRAQASALGLDLDAATIVSPLETELVEKFAAAYAEARAHKGMRERGTGTIINVSSTAGYMAMGGYSAIKTWVTAYTESLANELYGTGVTVTALCPGWVRTEFHQRANINISSIPSVLWLDADRLVADCLQDAAAGKVISIPSKRYKILMAESWSAKDRANFTTRRSSTPPTSVTSCSIEARSVMSQRRQRPGRSCCRCIGT